MEDPADEIADLAEVAPELPESVTLAAPQVVALKLLHFAHDNLGDIIGPGEHAEFGHKTVYVHRLKQLAGKLAFAIDLLEGRATVSEESEVPA